MADDKKTPENENVPDPSEGPGKGKAFFDRARTVAATGNFDYAIEMYIQGLNREPFNVAEHQALREVAMHRKVKGGKSGGGLLGMGGAKMPFKGKTPKEAMLNNEFTLARDVGSINAMLAVIRNADLMNLRDVVIWMGPLLKEANRTNKKPQVEIYTELGSIYDKYEEYERACDVINEAAKLKPYDADLPSIAQSYAAKSTIKRGKYDKEESFQGSIKDVEGTKKLLEEENLGKSEEYRRKAVEESRVAYEKNPKELQVIAKYAKSLVEMDDEAHEEIAMKMLAKAFEETKIYRLKAGIGDIRMKQFKRNLRMLREAVKADPKDKEMLHHYHELDKERLAYELSEFKERAEYMPTEMMVKYELGVRLYESKHYDEAIAAFQEAQVNPKIRVEALHLLGRSFLIQNMKPEAVETLKRSIEEYDLASTGNGKSLDLHYWYGRALEDNKQVTEAIDIYSKIVRWNMGYMDARKRLNDLRAQAGGITDGADVEQPPVLGYRGAPRKRNHGWLAAVICGGVAGVMIGNSGFGLLCLAPALGLLAGALPSFWAVRHRFWCGLLGAGICIMTAAVAVTLYNWRAGFRTEAGEFLVRTALLACFIGLPAVFGSTIFAVIAAREPEAH